ncbi:MAG: AraC family transcriptional regulator [Lachnospiraceae bacterium]|jgi:AraC family transcriptional regulator of arabinose operon|nr:AraC family transcriptional regulator [Lachnospiraceae bacterium]
MFIPPRQSSGQEPLTFTGHSRKYPSLPLALDGLGLYHLQEHVDRPGMEFWQWIQCIQGRGVLLLGESSYPVEEGGGILLPAQCPHTYYGLTKTWYTSFLCIGGPLLGPLMELLEFTQPGVYQLSAPEQILNLEQEIFHLYLENETRSAPEISKLLYRLLLELSADAKHAHSSLSSLEDDRVHTAIRYMQEHYGDPIGLSEIASQVHLSREYFCQLFKKATDSTVLEYLTQIRLSEAKTLLLKCPDKTIREISQLCGFDTPSYFCAVFKKHEHMTPLQFSQARNHTLGGSLL